MSASGPNVLGRRWAAGAQMPETPTATPSKQTAKLEEVKELDTALVQVIENKLETFESFFQHASQRRKVISIVASVAGTVLDQSGSSTSAQDSAGASKALDTASGHLDAILQTPELNTTATPHTFTEYLAKLDRRTDLRELQESDNAMEFPKDADTWHLIKLAATASGEVYGDLKKTAASWNIETAKYSSLKCTTISVHKSRGRQILVISIRGSVTMRDWIVNANGTPVPSNELHGVSNTWHRGFLAVAKAMQKEIAKEATEIKTSDDIGQIDELMFTGHSAGGAIAQLFYAMSMSANYAMSSLVSGFKKVHCITFGCPPVSTSPIVPSETRLFQSGLFLNIVNEGDPVPLSQEGYIKLLLEVYALSDSEWSKRYPHGFTVPLPTFKVSGQCIVLQDTNPEDTASATWKAVVVEAGQLEKRFFGNPLLHLMRHYCTRVQAISTSVGLQEGMSDAETEVGSAGSEAKTGSLSA